ncbi:protein mono-ADP-ribosyltransferase PARP4 [Sphaeramia orbicularis]|uniref:Poly [ADP-ribose] polymerase n=1 Tax=Sphaeramia orbicularis TaxID=375764 RepID=A0A673BHP7_9TELE|nr:protein mono-ADP-ribosyltransferase PARP4 [Sphaeramia orbicularis]
MALFKDCSVLLELKNLPFKEKRKLKLAVTENGGNISFVVNKQCSLIVTSDVSSLSSNRLRSINKHKTPVVGVDYVDSCVEAGVLLPVDDFKLETSSSSPYSFPEFKVFQVSQSRAAAKPSKAKPVDSVICGPLTQRAEPEYGAGSVLEKFRIYTETDPDLPSYPDHFHVAKYSVFEKINSNSWCVLELQSVKGQKGQQYRVVRYWKDDIGAKKAAVRDMLVFLSTSEEALETYQALRDSMKTTGLQLRSSSSLKSKGLGSAPLQQLLLEEELNTGSLSNEVGVFVELLWTDALGGLGSILRESINNLSLNDVSRAEGLLLQAARKLKDGNHMEVMSLLMEVQTLIPHAIKNIFPTAKFISQELDLCQLIRDVLNVREMTLRTPRPSSLGKYRALRCSIEAVPTSSSEFQNVTALLQDRKIQIHQVLRVCRGVELQTFKSELGNIRPLLHSSRSSNFVGILSRGLLLPRVGVEDHGIERTDIGNLGSGIYFADAISASLKYSSPSETDGSRLLLVCDVALGQCKDVHKRDPTLTQAPKGHNSVHGVRCTPNTHSDFQDDEYVVYSPDQVKLKYVVQFSVQGDQQKNFSPNITTSDEPCLPPSDKEMGSDSEGIENIKNPLADVKPGLQDNAGQQLPLQAVHVKCKLMDLLCQVVIFQKYTNQSSVPIEAKYVFPLDDSAAVCGFEAFINGKHVVGQVKEKEKARKEYKQAIEKGHGAYLMDQDAPDVFTISVGNLPPGATVLIKVTFVSELIVKDGSILFSLPGSVAPWQEREALNQTTQVTVEKVRVTDDETNTREFTLDMSIDMPNNITSLQCITHKVKMKRTDCKAVVSVLPGEVMGPEGFQLSITLSKVHLPRMWVEKHPDKDSQACMLVFYPDFEVPSGSSSDEVVLLLDASESMRGESLSTARRIALQVLKILDHNLRVNVIFFGTDHSEAFLTSQPLVKARQAAEGFIKGSCPAGGSTELWRPLRALSLLPPSRGIRNLLLLSDGHIQNTELTLQLLRDNTQHSRLFTCGLSPTANRHMLRAMACAGGGAYEFFDAKTKHNWAEQVACQVKRMSSPGCSSVSVKWQQFNPTAPPPVQAPKQLQALFNDCHTLVYGFVPHCTQATLLGDLSGQELKTMVSTSELQKTKGTFLHKLTARAIIRDYEDGILDANEAEHEGKKAQLKSFIIDLSKEFSILSQFTSFVAIEERDSEQPEKGFTDIPKVIAEEDVDFLPYMSWISSQDSDIQDEEEGYYATECADFMETSDGEIQYEEDYYETMCADETEDVGSILADAICMSEAISRPYRASSFAEKYEVRSFTHELQDYGRNLEMDLVPLSAICDGYLFGSDPAPAPPRSAVAPPRSAPAPLRLAPAPPRSAVAPPCSAPAPPHSAVAPPRSAAALLPSVLAAPTSALAPPPPSLAPPPPSLAPPPPSLSPTSSALARLCSAPPTDDSYYYCRNSSCPPPPPPLRHHLGALSFGDVPFGELVENTLGVQGCGFSQPAPLARAGAPSEQPANSLSAVRHKLMLGKQQQQQQALPSKSVFSSGLSTALVKAASAVVEPPCGFSFGSSAPPPIRGAAKQVTTELERFRAHNVPMSFGGVIQSPKHKALSQKPRAIRRKLEAPQFVDLTQDIEERERTKPRPRPVCGSFRSLHSRRSTTDLEPKWADIFEKQHSEGYWELTPELGGLLNLDVSLFVNVFLKSKGIHSLGVKAHADILKLLGTLLVLQLMRLKKLEEGKLLHSLFCLEESSPRPERWEKVDRAVKWVCWADRQYPCVYSRLELGWSWESCTRQLLGFEPIPHFSSLSGLNLQISPIPLLVR